MERSFFVSLEGNDNNSGSMKAPWLTIAKVNATNLRPGDRIFFKGGQAFPGSLVFLNAYGTSDKPILVTSYGIGRAQIRSENEGTPHLKPRRILYF
jgi:hypothetical protein